ncbi:MAG: ABC transporter permease, partial [Longicatena sp.]
KESGLGEQFQVNLEKQMQLLVNEFSTTIATTLKMQLASQMEKQMGVMLTQIQDAIRVDGTMFSKAIKMNMNEKELSELMMSLMMKETSTFDGNLKKLGYSNINKPNGISIYPKDFVSKQKVLDVLDKYNEDMKKVDEDKVISYTDYVGTLMSSVTDIIDVISYVLIAFVAISLVVSSIMIGVITYISVLERKKEIGILRAMGASKKNISQVFNAETFIIGLLAGILGIVVTLLLLIPGNMVIHEIAGNSLVNASLPIVGAIVLILLSVVLTLLGGLIPSKKASHEDPVTALRTE